MTPEQGVIVASKQALSPEQEAFVRGLYVRWQLRRLVVGGADRTLKELAMACCDRRALAYQLGPLNDLKHSELMLRIGLRLGVLTPLGHVQPMGHA